jgi:hypothetical protein
MIRSRLLPLLVTGLLAVPTGAFAHAQAPTPTQRIVVVCDDEQGTTRSTELAARARLQAALHRLVGTTPVLFVWQPITDHSFGQSPIISVSMTTVAPLTNTKCSPFDFHCLQQLKAVRQTHDRATSHLTQSIDTAFAHLNKVSVPRARHAADVAGCVAAAGQVFRPHATNYLIVLSSMQPAPGTLPHMTLRQADLDVVWSPASGSVTQAKADQHAWQAALTPLVSDQLWLLSSSLPAWLPIGKS